MWRSIFAAALLCAAVAAQSKEDGKKGDAFSGVFSNDNLKLELRHISKGRYQGLVLFNGKTYPLAARADHVTLKGSFADEGMSFTFTAKLDGEKLHFVTGGVEYGLRRESLANPLAEPPRQLSANRGSAKLHRHPSGAVFPVPDGWTVRDTSQAAILTPPGVGSGGNSPEELYVIASHEGYDSPDDPKLVNQLRRDLAGTGLFFERAGERQAYSEGGRTITVLTWELKSPETGEPMLIRAFLVQSGEHIQSLAAVGARDRVLGWDAQLRRIAAGMKFEPAQIDRGGSTNELFRFWTNRLAGSVLTQVGDSGGISSKKVLELDADGSFRYTGSAAAAAAAGSNAAAGQAASGRWRVVVHGAKAFLELTFDDGSQNILPLSQNGDETIVDGVRTIVTAAEKH
jgi:hypothetical protein